MIGNKCENYIYTHTCICDEIPVENLKCVPVGIFFYTNILMRTDGFGFFFTDDKSENTPKTTILVQNSMWDLLCRYNIYSL